MSSALATPRLIALFCGAAVLFNFPLLALWDREFSVWGVPLLPVALFGVWAVLIAILGFLMEWRAVQARED